MAAVLGTGDSFFRWLSSAPSGLESPVGTDHCSIILEYGVLIAGWDKE